MRNAVYNWILFIIAEVKNFKAFHRFHSVAIQQSHHCVMERKPGSKHTSNVKVVTLYASIREAIKPKRKEGSITEYL